MLGRGGILVQLASHRNPPRLVELKLKELTVIERLECRRPRERAIHPLHLFKKRGEGPRFNVERSIARKTTRSDNQDSPETRAVRESPDVPESEERICTLRREHDIHGVALGHLTNRR